MTNRQICYPYCQWNSFCVVTLHFCHSVWSNFLKKYSFHSSFNGISTVYLCFSKQKIGERGKKLPMFHCIYNFGRICLRFPIYRNSLNSVILDTNVFCINFNNFQFWSWIILLFCHICVEYAAFTHWHKLKVCSVLYTMSHFLAFLYSSL